MAGIKTLFFSRLSLSIRNVVAMGIVLGIAAPSTVRADTTVSSSQVISAIRRGAEYLLKKERSDKLWEYGYINSGYIPQHGGRTALATQTLLQVGQSLNMPELNIFSPKMRAAINYTANMYSKDTYVISFQANAMALLPPTRRFMKVLHQDEQLLADGMTLPGAYSYRLKSKSKLKGILIGGEWDNSNTQYGLLGMWAVAHAGIPVPQSYWLNAAKHWRTFQYADGTWGYAYHRRIPQRGAMSGRPDSMTSAGLASLFIANEFRQKIIRDPTITRGLSWLSHHIHPHDDDTYVTYGYARAGLASGLQYFGRTNWFRTIAAHLLSTQHRHGDWEADIQGPPQLENRIVGTCFALLTLVRGLNPVLFNKLQYSPRYYGRWNIDPRDDANITAWISKTFEAPMNWQIVNIKSPLSDWLDSPILFISGRVDPHFSHSEIDKISRYIQAGGLVFSSSNDNSSVFTVAMKKYAQQIVHHLYPVKQLSVKSSIYTLQPWYHLKNNPGWLGVSNGVRYLWIISPTDCSNIWQQHAYQQKDYWELPANLYLYANGKGALANKLSGLNVPPAESPPVRSIHMALVKYHGNWSPEPGAWPRMAKLAALNFCTRLQISACRVSQLNVAKTPIAHLTGVGQFQFTATQVANLKRFLDHGGLLFADAIGGKQVFTRYFQRLVRELYPSTTLEKLKNSSIIYRGTMPGGINTTLVNYRKYYTRRYGINSFPELLGMKKAGRWVILFSPDDITSGLLGTHTWGISGYTPSSAQALARNIVLYMCEKSPTTRPTTSATKPASPATQSSND